jgi:hypothetical protein
MKIGKGDLFLIATAIEQLYMKNYKLPLNEAGIRRLALIKCQISAELLPVNVKDIIEPMTERMLSEIDYSK